MEKSWVTIAVSVASFMIAATMNKDGALSFDYLDGKGLFLSLIHISWIGRYTTNYINNFKNED